MVLVLVICIIVRQHRKPDKWEIAVSRAQDRGFEPFGVAKIRTAVAVIVECGPAELKLMAPIGGRLIFVAGHVRK